MKRQTVIGIASLLLMLLIFVALIILWPVGNEPGLTGWFKDSKINNLPFETRLFLIVLLSGALGSLIFTLTSFARHIGTGDYSDTWSWWYVLRVPIGMALAIVMYFALRGGFFAPTTNGNISAKDIVNPFGFATIAALAGLFSKQAVDKLKELFDAIFKVSEKPVKVKLTIKTVSPASLKIGQEDVALTLIGQGFTADTIAQVNGVVYDTTFLNGEAMDVILTKEDVAQKGALSVFALNMGKDGSTSDPVTVNVK